MKQLKLHHQSYPLTTLPVFRKEWGLPDEFSVAYFEPKDTAGLGSLEGASSALALVKQRVLQSVPAKTRVADVMTYAEGLSRIFEPELTAVNTQIGLKPVEIEFAVAGFEDVLRSVAYKLIELQYTHRQNPQQIEADFDFATIYQDWLDDSTRLGGLVHNYEASPPQFEVQIIYNVYGRIGLAVTVNEEIYYVYDPTLSCPASNFMLNFSEAAAMALCRHFS